MTTDLNRLKYLSGLTESLNVDESDNPYPAHVAKELVKQLLDVRESADVAEFYGVVAQIDDLIAQLKAGEY